MKNEPVRLSGYLALAVGLGSLTLLGWAQGLDLKGIIVLVVPVLLSSVGGLEFARSKVWPANSVAAERSEAAVTAVESFLNDDVVEDEH